VLYDGHSLAASLRLLRNVALHGTLHATHDEVASSLGSYTVAMPTMQSWREALTD
jgi:hypothetical protein